MTTGEEWHKLMYDAMASEEEGCEPRLGGCLPYWWAALYFCSYSLVGMYMLSNLFVAVVVDNFGQSNASVLDETYRTHLRKAWNEHSDGRYLPVCNLEAFLKDIGPPLGLYPHSRRVKEFVGCLDLQAVRGNAQGDGAVIHQSELYPKLFHNAFGTPLPEKDERRLKAQMERMHVKLKGEAQSEDATPLRDIQRVVKIQAICRGFLTRCRIRRLKREYRRKHRWQEHETDDGDTYYYDVVTGVSSWEKPPNLCITEADLREWYTQRNREAKAAPNEEQEADGAADDSRLDVVARGPENKWVEYSDDATGTAYYHDVLSGQTVWEKPLFYCQEL